MSAAIDISVFEGKTMKREKRTEQQMIGDLAGNPIKQANYVLDRVAKLEEKIRELVNAASDEAKMLVFTQRPDLGGK